MRLAPVLALVLCACSAQQEDPGRLLRLATEATGRVKAVSYDFRYRAETADRPAVPFDGHMLLERMKDSLNFRMRMNATRDGRRMLIVADGEIVHSMDPDERTIRSSSIYSAGGALRAAAQPAVMEAFLKPDPFADELDGESISLEGSDVVGGRPCDVIRVGYTDDDEDSRWCLDAGTRLPLRLEWISAEGTERLELTNLVIDPPVEAEAFTMETPEGFAEESYSLGLRKGTVAPDWTLQGPDGLTVSSRELRGRVVVLDFWASWCPPCIESMAALQHLHEEIAGQPISIFGVQAMDGADPVVFMKSRDLRYGLLLDGDDLLVSMMGGASIPSAVVIDRDGRVVGTTSGYYGDGSHRYLRHLVELALGRPIRSDS